MFWKHKDALLSEVSDIWLTSSVEFVTFEQQVELPALVESIVKQRYSASLTTGDCNQSDASSPSLQTLSDLEHLSGLSLVGPTQIAIASQSGEAVRALRRAFQEGVHADAIRHGTGAVAGVITLLPTPLFLMSTQDDPGPQHVLMRSADGSAVFSVCEICLSNGKRDHDRHYWKDTVFPVLLK
jgi:hypothetical protein